MTEVTERSTKRDLVEDTFGIRVQGTVSLQGYDKVWGEFVDVEIKDLKNRHKIKVMIFESCLHTRKPRSHAEQLCTPLPETSGATICEGCEKAVDRLLQNLEDRKSSLEYRLQLAQATLASLQESSGQSLSTLVKSVPNRFACPPLEDVSINNEYEYENDFKPYSYSKSFSQLSMLAMTPSSSL